MSQVYRERGVWFPESVTIQMSPGTLTLVKKLHERKGKGSGWLPRLLTGGLETPLWCSRPFSHPMIPPGIFLCKRLSELLFPFLCIEFNSFSFTHLINIYWDSNFVPGPVLGPEDNVAKETAEPALGELHSQQAGTDKKDSVLACWSSSLRSPPTFSSSLSCSARSFLSPASKCELPSSSIGSSRMVILHMFARLSDESLRLPWPRSCTRTGFLSLSHCHPSS